MSQRRVALGSRSAGSCVRGRIAIHACRSCVMHSTSLCHTHVIHIALSYTYTRVEICEHICVCIYICKESKRRREREREMLVALV